MKLRYKYALGTLATYCGLIVLLLVAYAIGGGVAVAGVLIGATFVGMAFHIGYMDEDKK